MKFVLLMGFLAVGGISSCAPTIDSTPTGASGGLGGSDGGSTASTGGGAPGVWTDCSSPEGYQVCGGTHDCGASCPYCDPISLTSVTLCINDALQGFAGGGCHLVPDGGICVRLDDDLDVWQAVPYNMGILYAGNGAPQLVRYADYGLWTGDPLPEPDTCPTFDGFSVCGGKCGGCGNGDVCTGRSRLHPYGICVPEHSDNCPGGSTPACKSGLGCFSFLVESEAQPLAEEHNLCIPLDTCQKAAISYPGGAKCVP